MSKDLKSHGLALAGYLVVTLIFSYPLILNFTTFILGPMEDNIGYLWLLNWVKYCLAEGKSSLFFNQFLFYPKGLDLSFNSFAYPKTVLSLPFQYFFNVITAYNILTVASYVLSGFGVYLLVRHLVGRPGVAFVSGLIYAFSSTHVWHLDHHMDVSTIETIPFFIFFFIRFYEEGRTKDLVWAGVFFVLTALSCWYYMIYLLFFLVVFFGYFLAKEKVLNRLKETAMMLGGAFAVITPFLYPLIAVKFSGRKFLATPSTLNCVTDLTAPFVPSLKHPLAGWLDLGSYYKSLPCFPWETNVFIGYTVLLLAVYGFVKVPNRWTRFMALMGGVFWVLALGSHFQFAGQPFMENMLLPYYWLVEKIPMVNSMRVPARFMVMVMLALAVLYGYGLDFWQGRLEKKGKSKAAWLVVAAGILVFLEFMSYPNQLLDVERMTQARYLARNLPGEEGEYTVLELPISRNYVYNMMMMYRQSIHRKKILGGHAGRLEADAFDFIKRSPLGALLDGKVRIDLNYLRSLKGFLIENRIKYIVFNRFLVRNQKYMSFMDRSLSRVFSVQSELGKKLTVYKVY